MMIHPTVFILATIQLFQYIGHSAWAGALAVLAWYPISALGSYLFSGRFDAVSPKLSRSDALVSDVGSSKGYSRHYPALTNWEKLTFVSCCVRSFWQTSSLSSFLGGRRFC
jgi:hypothetical protein